MKISCHQPYFFPYIGYFQLINNADIFINLDHVSYMKRSFMTRNTLKNNTEINIPVLGGSQNKSCREVYADCTDRWFEKFAKTLDLLYKNEINYCIVMEEVLSPWYEFIKEWKNYPDPVQNNFIDISMFNYTSIFYICQYLNIKTRLVISSRGFTKEKKEKGLQEIVKWYKGTHYINAIGGTSLYDKKDFLDQGIILNFIKNKSELPNTSILDILFRYPKEQIKEELNNYELI